MAGEEVKKFYENLSYISFLATLLLSMIEFLKKRQ